MVPHWLREKKKLRKSSAKNRQLDMQLNRSAGWKHCYTQEGITAEIVEVTPFDELKNLGRKKLPVNCFLQSSFLM